MNLTSHVAEDLTVNNTLYFVFFSENILIIWNENIRIFEYLLIFIIAL